MKRKIERAAEEGKTEFDVEPGDLDGILGRGKISYDDVADKLKALGYQAFADGFTGVSASWDD